MAKYRKKPVVIDAIQFDGSNFQEVFDWVGQWEPEDDGPGMWQDENNAEVLIIHTLEGEMSAGKQDWIIRGIKGEFYPCKPDIFEATYEKVQLSAKNKTENVMAIGMVRAWLTAEGYDGLYTDDCGCLADDLMPCGEFGTNCEPGYKVPDSDDCKNKSQDWHISGKKVG